MTSTTESTSLVQRCTDFVSEHKKAVILGTAAVAIAAGGAAYYASTSRRPGGGDGDVEKGDSRKSKDKKKSKSSKKRKTVNDKDGPLLEERTAKVEEGDGKYPSTRTASHKDAMAHALFCNRRQTVNGRTN